MKSIKISLCLILLTTVLNLRAKAQMFASDVNGSAIRASRYTDVNGSPYLTSNWEKATVAIDNGQTYNLDVKYDQVADQLMFRNKSGDSLYFNQPVKEFKITYYSDNKPQTHLYRSGFAPAAPKTTTSSFYEVLNNGATKLLKRTAKSVWMETTTYGTANQTKNITENISYYAVAPSGAITPIKADKKSVMAALNNKAPEIEKYIKDNKLNLKQDTDLAKVFEYYNSLN